MIYKVKKYYPAGVDRRQMLQAGYAKTHAVGTDATEYKHQDFWPVLEKHLRKDASYLDAGCGIGGWVLFLKDEGYSIEGMDEAANVLRAMTEYKPDLKVKQGKLIALPYADGAFDGVLSIGSLDHEEDSLQQALHEMRRVLKPDGLLFLEVPLLNTQRRFKYVPAKRLEALVRRALGHREVFAGYLFDRSSLQDLLVKNGFSVFHMQPHDLTKEGQHYGLYVDWPILRGSKPYELNMLGRLVKAIWSLGSPWAMATGVVVVARKK
jgi:ubiquinone/menaquinone biosynthesis C-methylase UbiE